MAQSRIIYTIKWSKKAEEQLYSILDYWTTRNQSASYSLKLLDEIDKKLSIFSQRPYASSKTRYPTIRKCSLGDYSILFKLQSKVIYIVVFWYDRRNPDDLNDVLNYQKGKTHSGSQTVLDYLMHTF